MSEDSTLDKYLMDGNITRVKDILRGTNPKKVDHASDMVMKYLELCQGKKVVFPNGEIVEHPRDYVDSLQGGYGLGPLTAMLIVNSIKIPRRF